MAPLRFLHPILALALVIGTTKSLPEVIRIGGLFDMADTVQEIAFRYAVDRVNVDRDILPRSRLTAQIERIPQQDSFYASKQVCKALKAGMAGLFGPQSSVTSSHVQSICDTLEIPHIETRWDYRMQRDDYSVNLYPHPHALGQAYVAMLVAMNWMSFVVLYEDSDGLVRLQEVLKLSSIYSDLHIKVRQLIPASGGDYRPLLKDIKSSGETRIVLDCKTESIYEILKQAQQVGVMTAYHSYFITSLDLHMVELEDFKYGGTNISSFRMVDPSNEVVLSVVQDWVKGEMRFNRKIPFAGKTIKTETALIYDAVQMFAKALTDLDRSQEVQTASIDCTGRETWQHGNSLVNYMKMVELEGLTGKIKFDSLGFRSDFNLDIIELKKEGLVQVGVWNQGSGANFTRNYTESYSEIVESLHNKTLKITTILNEPYTMYRENSEALSGNDRFEGYNVDLIDEVSKILGFNYTINIVADGKYGSYNAKNKTWNGMVGELLSQKADLAVADLTITYEREQGVDFTMPFMNLGVTILFKKPTAKDPNLFSFLSPLSLGVWIYIVTAYLAVSLLLYVIARCSPYEKGYTYFADNGKSDEKGSRLAKPDPIYETLFSGANGRLARTVGTQVGHPDEVQGATNRLDEEMTFTLLNSFWFMTASLLQQGTDLLPRAVSTRMVAGMWWFFTLIMISSYTANLAAFLTVERMESPIESAEDLSKQSTIKYGCLKGGSTAAFFRDSKIPTYSRMWVFMESDEKNFVGSNAGGVDRVRKENGKYAFLMESTTVEYIIERDCELTQIGSLLDSKGYGIALPPNSPYRTPISSAILQLQEGGKLHMLKEKWWKQRKGGGKCKEVQESGAAALGLSNVGGVFVVLIGGMTLACIVAFCESVWNKKQQKRAALLQASLSQSTCTETSTGTLTRTSGGFGGTMCERDRILGLPFENGHVTHLDLAAVHPRTNHHHMHTDFRDGGYITSSLSAAALNANSCAVPMMDLGNSNARNVQLVHSSSLGWGSNNANNTLGRGIRYQQQHQEECPHFNNYKEAPT